VTTNGSVLRVMSLELCVFVDESLYSTPINNHLIVIPGLTLKGMKPMRVLLIRTASPWRRCSQK